MAVSKAKKTEILEELKTLLKNSKSVWFTSNSGLSVDDITNLRISLREVDSTITLAKKTLIKIAFKEVYDVDITDDLLPGQIAMVCSNEDAIAGLGKVNEYIKKDEDDKMIWTGSFMEWELQDAEATKKLAGMPSRETLLGRLVGSMQSPLSGLARFFDAAAKDIESQGKQKVGELEWEPKAEEAPALVEEKKEEAKTEEAPKVEAKVEEEVKETPETKAEAPVEKAEEPAKTEAKPEAPVEEEAKVEEAPKAEADDLTKVEGIGPKTSEALVAAGVATFAELAKKTPEEISEIIAEVRGSHVTDTWPKQAEMAAAGNWDELKKWQDEMDWGKPAEEKA